MKSEAIVCQLKTIRAFAETLSNFDADYIATAMGVLSRELNREIVRRRRLKREIDSGSAR